MSDHASDRRTFLKRAGAASAAVVASRLPVPGSASAQDATVKPDPAAKRGGTLRFGVHTAPAHFDVHQHSPHLLEQGFDGQDRSEHVALIVRCTTSVYPVIAHLWLKGWARPLVQWVGRLRIKMTIDHYRRLPGRM